MERKRVGVHRAVRPYLGLKASLSSLPGWQELRIITLPPRFYSVHSFGYVAGRGGGGVLPRFFRSKNSLPLGQRRLSPPIALFPFPHRVCTRELWRGWVGERQPFFFLPLRLSTGKAPSPGMRRTAVAPLLPSPRQ